MVYHLLGMSRTISSYEFSTCPFTQLLMGLATMLKSDEDNIVYHYGAETSEIECDEHIDVVTIKELEESLGKDFRRQEKYVVIGYDSLAKKLFDTRAIHELRKRVNPGDILCVTGGISYKNIVDELRGLDLIVVEPFASYYKMFCSAKVFPSISWAHYMYGRFHERWEQLPQEQKENPDFWSPVCEPFYVPKWEDDIIPHYLNMDNFKPSQNKGDYFLHMSRIVPGKGIEMAVKICQHLDVKLKIAGQGDIKNVLSFDLPKNVELIGVLGPEERSRAISEAIGGFCLTENPEPFGLVGIEYQACDIPAIGTNWGAYTETIRHGKTGYKIRSFSEGIEAVKNIDKIKPGACRKWIKNNYSIEAVSDRYKAYFKRLSNHLRAQKEKKGIYYLPNDLSN